MNESDKQTLHTHLNGKKGDSMKSKKIRIVTTYLQNLVSPKRYEMVTRRLIVIAAAVIGLGAETVSEPNHRAIWGATSLRWQETCVRTIERLCEDAFTFGNCDDVIAQHCAVDTSGEDRSFGSHQDEWIEWKYPEFEQRGVGSPTNKIQGVWRSPSIGWISCRPFLGLGCGDWANREFRLYIVQHFWGIPQRAPHNMSCYQGMVTTDVNSDPNFFNEQDYKDLADYCRSALGRRY